MLSKVLSLLNATFRLAVGRAAHRAVTTFLSVAIVAAGVFVWQPATAQLRVSESVIEMQASDQRTTIPISNTGSAPLQVAIKLNNVQAPSIHGSAKGITSVVKSEVMRIEPNRFEILPGETVEVAVHRTAGDLDNDEIYRMHVTPSLIRPQNGASILLSYDLLLIVLPNNPLPDIQIRKTTEELALVNLGNSNALLSSVQICDELMGHCQSLPNLRLHTRQRMPLLIPPQFDQKHIVIKTVQTHRAQVEQIDYRLPSVPVSW